jgi:hypothetical protein
MDLLYPEAAGGLTSVLDKWTACANIKECVCYIVASFFIVFLANKAQHSTAQRRLLERVD